MALRVFSSGEDGGGSDDNSITIEYLTWPIIRYKREVLFGWVDLLVSFGGIAGLFLGFSLLSGVEILYYFTMRTCCMVYKNRVSGLHRIGIRFYQFATTTKRRTFCTPSMTRNYTANQKRPPIIHSPTLHPLDKCCWSNRLATTRLVVARCCRSD